MSADERPVADLIADAARISWGLDDFELDLTIAMTQARRDVNAAHGRSGAADHWNDLLIALADARTLRAKTAREVSDALDFGGQL